MGTNYPAPSVLVSLVTHNSGDNICTVINSMLDQTYVSECIAHVRQKPKTAALTGIIYKVSNFNETTRKRALDFYQITRYRKTKPIIKKLNLKKTTLLGVTGTAAFF